MNTEFRRGPRMTITIKGLQKKEYLWILERFCPEATTEWEI